MHQKQSQTQKTCELQVLKDHIQQDALNFLCILYETQEVLQHFKEQKQHPMIPIFINRLHTQISLSSAVHVDIHFSHEQFKKEIMQDKKDLYNKIREIKESDQFKDLDDQLKQYLDSYLGNILSENPSFLNYKTQQIPKEAGSAQFNPDVVSSVITSMQNQVDRQQKVKSGELKVTKLETKEIKEKINERITRAKEKLNQNWLKFQPKDQPNFLPKHQSTPLARLPPNQADDMSVEYPDENHNSPMIQQLPGEAQQQNSMSIEQTSDSQRQATNPANQSNIIDEEVTQQSATPSQEQLQTPSVDQQAQQAPLNDVSLPEEQGKPEDQAERQQMLPSQAAEDNSEDNRKAIGQEHQQSADRLAQAAPLGQNNSDQQPNSEDQPHQNDSNGQTIDIEKRL